MLTEKVAEKGQKEVELKVVKVLQKEVKIIKVVDNRIKLDGGEES